MKGQITKFLQGGILTAACIFLAFWAAFGEDCVFDKGEPTVTEVKETEAAVDYGRDEEIKENLQDAGETEENFALPDTEEFDQNVYVSEEEKQRKIEELFADTDGSQVTHSYIYQEEINGKDAFALVDQMEGDWEDFIPVWDEQTEKERYIRRQSYTMGGLEYKDMWHFDYPNSFFVGITYLDSDMSAVFPDSSDTEIVFNVASNIRGRNDFSKHWEEFCSNTAMAMEEVLGEMADHLSFEWYYLDNGDAVYMYSFEMEDKHGEKWVEAVGYRLCENLSAEFIGISPQRECCPVRDMVRYMAADFNDFSELEENEVYSLDGCMPGSYAYVGADEWKYSDFHNAFIMGYKKITGNSWKAKMDPESFLHKAKEEDVQVLFHSPIAEASFQYFLGKMGEPVYLSDLENIYLVGFGEGYYDDFIYINDEEYQVSLEKIFQAYGRKMPEHYMEDLLLDLQNLPNLVDFMLYSVDSDSYGMVGNLTALKTLRLGASRREDSPQVEDVSFLRNLGDLENLILEDVFDRVKDWSVLANCPNIEYMYLLTQMSEDELILPEGTPIIVEH